MILKNPAVEEEPLSKQNWQRGSWSKAPLRWQLAIVTAVMVAAAVSVMTIVAYWTVSTSLNRSVDSELTTTAQSFLKRSNDPEFASKIDQELATFRTYNPNVQIRFFPQGEAEGYGDSILLVDEGEVIRGETQMSLRNQGDERVIAVNNAAGSTVVLSQDLGPTYALVSSLGMVLLIIAGLGTLMAIAAGMVVSTTGLRPVTRLQRAVEHVTATDSLEPIEVHGRDELAQLTRSFNDMLASLDASRRRQTELVADAGHELKTPLTSLRTNIELLMMVSKSPTPNFSDGDLQDLEKDVIAQIDELSTLIGDLVDLAREDSKRSELELVDLEDTMANSLERVRRRRPDVEFTFERAQWYLMGDSFALGRATVNLMDNAAKWSPPNGVVRLKMVPIDDKSIHVLVADSGPGIPEEEREKVFERFYRAVQARSMPGSGLGLSIVKQVIDRHNGTIEVRDSEDGGTLMQITLPGGRTPEAGRLHEKIDSNQTRELPFS
ncbi:HAMP domain-containing sensor histidine kinase [Corynebacterium sp. H130]|uniref:HAMP domain-containing sensor histidine kinase n=1 Tax=Corynebacterium sp. H130 TaxID=3133444 RepID=UPI00309A7CD8